jgi:hypothetical protein
MFSKSHTFSEEEQNTLFLVQHYYVQAMLARTHHPSDFDANIASLKGFKTAVHLFLQVLTPHFQKSVDKALGSHSIIFGLFKLGHEAHSSLGMMKEAQKIIYSKQLNQFMKSEFAKEPRITALNAKENFEETTKTTGGLHSTERVETTKYTITFSDGSELTLNSLEDEKELADAKRAFDEKMQALSNKSILWHHQ